MQNFIHKHIDLKTRFQEDKIYYIQRDTIYIYIYIWKFTNKPRTSLN